MSGMSRGFNPPGESVWLPRLFFLIRYFPARTKNTIGHAKHDIYMRVWNIVKIQIPYWLNNRGR
jgi:hypothetical protein